MAKIVLIFDRLLRPDTTGVHCEMALRETPHEIVAYAPYAAGEGAMHFKNYEDLPLDGDLYVQVDDDIGYPAPPVPAPKAYWCIDTHRMEIMVGGWTRWQKMQEFDQVFAAQKDGAEKIGAPWLPLAFNDKLWRKLEGCKKLYDWCFIGNMNDPKRRRITELLERSYPACFVGQAAGEEMNLIYNQSRIALNITLSNDVNMRFFESQGTGAPLMSNRVNNGEDLLFESVLYYEDEDDLLRLMDEHLRAEPRALQELGDRQRRHVLEHHTYRRRMRQLLEMCGL